MALNDPPNLKPSPDNISIPIVPNTIPDDLRKYVASGLMFAGAIILILGVVLLIFPTIGGNSGPALEWGATLLGAGGLTIWDRQKYSE